MRARPRAGSCFTSGASGFRACWACAWELLSGMRNMPLDLDGFVFRGVARFQFGVELSHMRKLRHVCCVAREPRAGRLSYRELVLSVVELEARRNRGL